MAKTTCRRCEYEFDEWIENGDIVDVCDSCIDIQHVISDAFYKVSSDKNNHDLNEKSVMYWSHKLIAN